MDLQHRPARQWLKITLSVPEQLSDTASALLANLTGSGIEISMPVGASPDVPARENLVGYLLNDEQRLAKEKELHNLVLQLQDSCADPAEIMLHSEEINEEDWGKTWKEHFRPMKISAHLVIKPTWEQYQAQADEQVLELDPGMAFGTGHHASTKLALSLVEELYGPNKPAPARVLDVGTGTGILGMACCLLGASQVLAIDNDPDAVAAARDNIVQNHLQDKMSAQGNDLATITDKFDLVLANIIHDTLIELAAELTERTKEGGHLILAGILKGDQEQNIITTYSQLGLHCVKAVSQDEWAALSFSK